MRKALFVLMALAALGGGVVALLRRAEEPGPPADAERKSGKAAEDQPTRPRLQRERAPWKPYGYRLAKSPRTRRYDLPVVIRTRSGASPNVRLLLDVQDEENYYFVELTAQSVRIGKVESGLELPIGTRSDIGLRPSGTNRLVIKRRHYSLEVILNNHLAAWAEDEAFHGGRIGAGVLRDSARVTLERPQPCDWIYFADDFMKGAGEETGWETVAGTWEIETLRNPSLSSNAFYYVGSATMDGKAAAAVRGQWFWDDYRLRVATVTGGQRDVGLLLYYRDPDNYYLFRWNADRQPDGSRGRKQLVKRWRGQETVLGEAPGGYQPGVWYEMEAEVVGQRVRMFIDGHLIFEVAEPSLCFGKIGLYAATDRHAATRFDDVLVQSVRSFHDSFSTEVAGRWSTLRGTWTQETIEDTPVRLVSSQEPARCITGSRRWRDYSLATTVRLPARLNGDSLAGLVGHYLDEMNYALFTWCPARGEARLEAVAGGSQVAAERADVPRGLPDTRHRLELVWEQNVVTGRLNGRPVVSAWVPKLPRGKAGLYGSTVDRLAFEHVRVSFPLPPEPVLTTHEVFSRERTMEIWAGAAQDWEETSETVDGHALRPRWHRATFFGDVTMELEVPEAAGDASGPRACHLVLSAESPKTVGTGYRFALAWPAEGKGPFTATLLRGQEAQAERAVALGAPPRRMRLERLGQHVIASVNDEQLLAFRDPQPLDGSRAAYATLGFDVPREEVKVFSDNVQVYTFSRASSDWRPAAGSWEISNRWECDPRWSFFSGVPEKGGKLAAIWSKFAYHGDVSVEFAIGPKMERARGGSRYSYVRDFNVTLCADGRDLNTGYTFLFGGWNNKKTAITRRGKVVAETSRRIPTGGIHRRWFYVKAEKRGSLLTYWIDGERVLSYKDPQPLEGTRAAIWTWDCGIMVSRVRFSADRIGEREPPGTPCGPCRTLYSP